MAARRSPSRSSDQAPFRPLERLRAQVASVGVSQLLPTKDRACADWSAAVANTSDSLVATGLDKMAVDAEQAAVRDPALAGWPKAISVYRDYLVTAANPDLATAPAERHAAQGPC
jgi:hypothetical protein